MILAGANVADVHLAEPTITSVPLISSGHGRYLTVKGVAADKGYDSDELRDHLRGRRIRSAIPYRENRVRRRYRWKPDLWPVRWKSERAHSWLNNYRRLKIRWERDDRLYLALTHFASALVAYRKWRFY